MSTIIRSRVALILATTASISLLSASLALSVWTTPAWATSASAGLQNDEGPGHSAPLGRIPPRPNNQRAATPVSPPVFTLTPPSIPSITEDGVYHPEAFTLSNGMAVVVVPNHRAPIISQMVWYQVGAADEPLGKSGLAHLLEHLMFKGTQNVPDGAFSRTVAANGGNDNAFTGWDYTAYFQNIAKDRLELVMQMEADRMVNLTLSEDQVTSERAVVYAERQQTTDNEPIDRLREAMRAALFVHHPYGRPIVGWADEIKALTREDALAFYHTWYSPSNAVLVVSGDITAEELKPIAERTYGKLAARDVPIRQRVQEPDLNAERRVILRDAGVSQPVLMRSYLAPSYRAGDRQQIVPLEVLSEIMGGGPTSRLYLRLVMDLRLATSVQFSYDPMAFDLSTASLSASPVAGRDLRLVETAMDAAVRELLINGISDAELANAKRRLVDGAIFARDSVQAPAYVFGMTLATGGDISDVEAWPKRVMDVTKEQVMAAAHAIFDEKGFVTGELLPDPSRPASSAPASGTGHGVVLSPAGGGVH